MFKTIDLAFICDNSYVLPTLVAVTSLKEHMHSDYQYRVHIICEKLLEENLKLLQSLGEGRLSVRIIDAGEGCRLDISKTYLHVSKAALQKFYLAAFLKDLDKVLYLDGDTIIQGDLVDFFNKDIENYYGAAVSDGSKNKNDNYMLCDSFFKPDYFNSGVMLLNLKLWRQQDLTPQLIAYRQNGVNYFMDQDAINAVFEGRMLLLPLTYNVMLHLFEPFFDIESPELLAQFYKMKKMVAFEQFFDEGIIIHYTFAKPWLYFDVPGADKWYFYYKKSPLGGQPLYLRSYYKQFYADLQKSMTHRVGTLLLYLPKKIKRLWHSI